MSMSVQSAWEDLVVENPNRRKLEACLVTTILCVVICIMGLLLFVVIQIQPADNLKYVANTLNIVMCDKGTCEQFGHRMLGWINFQGNPCEDFHDWACGGRQYDAPEKPYQIDAEMAGTQNANEAFYDLFVRYYDEEVASTTYPVHKVGLDYMRRLYDVCIRGVPDVTNDKGRIIDGYDMLVQGFYNHPDKKSVTRGFVQVEKQDDFVPFVADVMKLLNVHPFGRVQKISATEWKILPMRLLGTHEQLSLPGWVSGEFVAAYVGLATTYGLGSEQEGAKTIQVEAEMAKAHAALKPEDDFFTELLVPVTKLPRNNKEPESPLTQILKAVYGLDDTVKIRLESGGSHRALQAAINQKYQFMNMVTFKIFMMFSTFLNPAEPKMAPFFRFANRYHFGSDEAPVMAYRCGTLLENYLQPVMHQFIYKYDKERLDVIGRKWSSELANFTAPSTDRKIPTKVSQDATNAKSPLVYMMDESMHNMEFFYPPDNQTLEKISTAAYECDGALPDWDEAAPGKYIAHIVLLTQKLVCHQKGSGPRYFGTVLNSMPTYVHHEDKIYIPYGFTFPPNHHPYSDARLHHNAPAAYFQLFSVAYKRVIFKGVSYTGKGGFTGAHGQAATVEVKKGIDCIRKELATESKNKAGATQIYIDTVAVHHAYVMYRDLIHRQFDVTKQLRIPLVPFITEGMIFFIQAAQARCEYFSNNKTEGYTQKRSGASPADKVNIPFARTQPLFADRFGCHAQRPMAKAIKCPLPIRPLKRTAEKAHPGII